MNIRKIFILLLLSFSFAFYSSAAEVGKVNFDQTGSVTVPRDLINFNVSLKPGVQFSQEKLNDDIKALYNTGYFSDVEAKTTNTPSGKVDITYQLTNTPRIDKIDVKGNKKFSNDKILEQIVLKKDDPYSKDLLQQSLDNINKLYQGAGYYEASVYPSTINTKNGNIILTFNIDEHLRLKVNDVHFVGNTVFSSWTLSGTVQTSHSYLNWILDTGLYDKSVAKDDTLRIRNLYWTKGYLDCAVTVETKPLADDPSYVDVYFHIDQGAPYTVGKVTVKGDDTFSNEELMKLITIKSGEVYNYLKEEASIDAIKAKYNKLGFCDIVCKTDLVPDYKTHIVDIVFNVNEGQAFNVRNINITGNKITKDYVIRRELPIEPGDPVNNVLINAGKSRLEAMNYFSKVESYTSTTPNPSEKDVNYEVQEKSTAKASIGAGFSTDDGALARLTLSESDFDISDPSSYFRGGGQRVDLLAQIGTERSDLVLAFTEPWLFGIPLRLDTSGFYHTREYPYWDERHVGFELGLTKQIGEFNSVGLGYILDFVNVSQMSQNYAQSFINDMQGNSRQGALKLNLQRDTRDNLMNPTSGYLLFAKGLLNSEATGGSSNYYGLNLGASGYWNFFEKFLVLHAGAKAGTTGPIGGSNSDIPIYQRYFLGGQDSLRGFQYMMVSPLDQNNMPTGGLSMFSATFEVIHPIYKWIKGAPFVDIGNAWSDPFQASFDFNVGVGYGLRILIPEISSTPIRFDLGFPVYRTSSSYSSSPQFYFDVGADW